MSRLTACSPISKRKLHSLNPHLKQKQIIKHCFCFTCKLSERSLPSKSMNRPLFFLSKLKCYLQIKKIKTYYIYISDEDLNEVEESEIYVNNENMIPEERRATVVLKTFIEQHF